MTDAEHKLMQLQKAMKESAEYAIRFEGNPGERARLFVAGLVGATAAVLGDGEAEIIFQVLQREEQQ